MKIVFGKIPTAAKCFYFVGLLFIIPAMILFFYFPSLLTPVRLQQLFLLGAILVAVGSVVNTIFQFKDPKLTFKPRSRRNKRTVQDKDNV